MIKEKLVEVLIRSAITFEEETRAFYVRCMERESNDRIKDLFRTLVEEESDHKERLEELVSSDPKDVLEIDDQDIPSVVDLPDGESTKGAGAFGREYDILRTALDHEISSYNFYVLLGKRAALSVLKKTFNILAAEEERHINHVRAMIDELGSGSSDD